MSTPTRKLFRFPLKGFICRYDGITTITTTQHRCVFFGWDREEHSLLLDFNDGMCTDCCHLPFVKSYSVLGPQIMSPHHLSPTHQKYFYFKAFGLIKKTHLELPYVLQYIRVGLSHSAASFARHQSFPPSGVLSSNFLSPLYCAKDPYSNGNQQKKNNPNLHRYFQRRR